MPSGSLDGRSSIHMECVCNRCGAELGKLNLGGTNSLSSVLGVFLAGDARASPSGPRACTLTQSVMSHVTFHKYQKQVMGAIDVLRDDAHDQ